MKDPHHVPKFIHLRQSQTKQYTPFINNFRRSASKSSTVVKHPQSNIIDRPKSPYPPLQTPKNNVTESTKKKYTPTLNSPRNKVTIFGRASQPYRSTPVNKKWMCTNHLNRQAEFHINFDNEIIFYCSRCAAHLASQGFQVNKFCLSQRKSQEKVQQHQFFNRKNSIQKEISIFLNNLNQIRSHHVSTLTKCYKIQDIYQQQIDLLKSFYQTICLTIDKYRSQHIQGLQNECKQAIKDHEREINYLTKSINDIDDIIKDIKSNFEGILTKITQQQFNSCFNYYKHTVNTLQLKVQQIQNNIANIQTYNNNQLQFNISQIDKYIQQIISLNCKSIHTCIKPINLKIIDIKKKQNIKYQQQFKQTLQKFHGLLNDNQFIIQLDRCKSVAELRKSYQIQQKIQQKNQQEEDNIQSPQFKRI